MSAAIFSESFNIGKELLGFGLAVTGAAGLGKIALDKVKEIFHSSNFDGTLDSHSLHKKHKFDEICGAQCINQVKEHPNEVTKHGMDNNGVLFIEVQGNCQHGCTIAIRMSLPPALGHWHISTVFHVPEGVCLAKECWLKK